MRHVSVLLVVLLNLAFNASSQSGADCTNAIPLTLDGVTRTYATSASLGNPVLCTSYASNTPITFFRFTTNASADRVLIEITGPSAQPMEVLLYTSSCGTMYSASSMCFDDGAGLWSFSHATTVPANATYRLRVKTAIAGNITIKASSYNPANNLCSGATGIGPTPVADNNACNTAGTGVTPGDLCASSLENTAFYKYVVVNTGVSIININNIACDNQASNNNNGFQIGFFTGSCGALTPIGCYMGSGSFVSATTVSLPAGTEVFVAIDGVSGSNCAYEISVINGNVLATEIEDFTGWKNNNSNMLKWVAGKETAGAVYEIQRSENGRNYSTIGRVNSKGFSTGETEYQFEDVRPAMVSYYRLKNIQLDGKSTLSKVVEIRRSKPSGILLEMPNPVRNLLSMQIVTDNTARLQLTVFNSMGQAVLQDKLDCNKGTNQFTRSVQKLPAGNYHLLLSDEKTQSVSSFIKLN